MATATAIEEKKTQQQIALEKALAALAELSGERAGEDTIVHEGTKIVLPLTMGPTEAIDFLREYIELQETPTSFTRTFRYRPMDGAVALQRALLKVFGTSGIARATWTFFGRQPPEMIAVHVGVDETVNAPWGRISVPALEGTMTVGQQNSKEFGALFNLSIICPRKFTREVNGLFAIVQDELEERSIYKGKAIDGKDTPEFLDLSGVDPEKVIYSNETLRQMDANIWSVLRDRTVLQKLGITRKRAVLLEGPYGTGKTLGAFLTAQRAVENHWTFLYCRPGRDNLMQVMTTARLYQPACVFFEDVDTLAETAETDIVSQLLDIFDGITAKGTELLAVLTTNHKERIKKPMVRPGRLDAVIHVGALDRDGVERMIRATVEDGVLSPDIDYDEVYEAMEGYLPAFVKEAIDRTLRYAVARDGQAPEVLETEDFVLAASGLRPQLELMQEASEGATRDPLALALRREVFEGVQGTPIHDESGNLGGGHVLTIGANGDDA